MDETEPDGIVTVGQRLREAREAQGISLEEIAAQTRIPTRHLASLEVGDWDKLPAATYSIGFAKNYAGAVGLDRNEIGEQLRAEMGGGRLAMAHPEVFETVDPARTMPKGLVIGALAALALVVLALTWLNNRSLEPTAQPVESVEAGPPVENVVTPGPQPAAAAGPVVLTATDAVWLQIKDGATVLKQGQLAPGESFEVPANAVAPVLTTGKPEALKIKVGSADAPAVGQPGRTVSGVSLKAADLMRTGASPTAAAIAPAAPTAPQPSRQAARRPSASDSPPPTQTAEPTEPSTGNVSAPAPGIADTATTQL